MTGSALCAAEEVFAHYGLHGSASRMRCADRACLSSRDAHTIGLEARERLGIGADGAFASMIATHVMNENGAAIEAGVAAWRAGGAKAGLEAMDAVSIEAKKLA